MFVFIDLPIFDISYKCNPISGLFVTDLLHWSFFQDYNMLNFNLFMDEKHFIVGIYHILLMLPIRWRLLRLFSPFGYYGNTAVDILEHDVSFPFLSVCTSAWQGQSNGNSVFKFQRNCQASWSGYAISTFSTFSPTLIISWFRLVV